MRRIDLAIAAIAILLASADKIAGPGKVTAGDVGSRIIILGDLGQPVGAKITIQGEKVRASKGDQTHFFVDSVNGRALQRPTTVQIDRILDWPLGTKAEIRGQEVGTLTFTDIEKTGFAMNDPRFVLRQTLELSFRAAEVTAPAGLKLKPSER